MTQNERNQAQALHHRQVQGETLNDAEQTLVRQFLLTLSDEEATSRAAYNARQDALLAAKEARNQRLESLLQREERVVASLRDALHRAESERREIARERRQIESAAL